MQNGKQVVIALSVVLLFCVSIRCTFVPSPIIEVCNTRDDKCYPKIIVTGLLSDNGSPFGFSFTLDSSTGIQDQHGRKWAPEKPIFTTVQRSAISLHAALYRRNGFIYNAYVDKKPLSNYAMCPSQRLCCDSVSYGLSRNSTKYVVYDYDSTSYRISYTLAVNLKQGTLTRTLNMSPDITKAETDSVKATIGGQLINSVSFAQYVDQVVVHESVLENTELRIAPEPFMIPPNFFRSGSLNAIGMESGDFVAKARCAWAEDAARVNNGLRWDQFSTFRSKTFQNTMGCKRSTPIADIENKQKITLSCEKYATTLLSIELNTARNFKLIQLFGKPYVVDKGLLPYSEGSQTVVMYLDVMNIEEYQGEFVAQPKRCCRFLLCSEEDYKNFQIEPQKSYIILPSSTYRFRFQIVASQLFNSTNGFCEVSISQFGVEDLLVRVDLDFTASSPLATGSTPLEGEKCQNAGHIQYMKDGRKYCRPQCAGERQWDNERLLCVAPICEILYEGYRNFWNEDTSFCEALAVCIGTNLVYNQLTNQCDTKAPAVTENNNNNNNTTTVVEEDEDDSNSGTSGGSSSQDVSISIDCGVHGTPLPSGLACECERGYDTDYSQPAAIFKWCRQTVSVPEDPTADGSDANTPAVNPRSFKQVFKQLPGYVKAIIGTVIGVVVIGVVLFIVLIVFCLVRKKSQAKKKTELKKERMKSKLKRRQFSADDTLSDISFNSDDDLDSDEELKLLKELDKRERELQKSVQEKEKQKPKRNRPSTRGKPRPKQHTRRPPNAATTKSLKRETK